MSRTFATLAITLLTFNIGVMSAPLSVDGVRGALDTTKCKDCEEGSLPVSECHHWNPNIPDPNNPGQNLPVACKNSACIEDVIYFAKCATKLPSETSNCTMELMNALSTTQQARVLNAGDPRLACGMDPGEDTSTWPRAPGLPPNGDCFQRNWNGKCFIPSCPGNDVDMIDGVAPDPTRTFNRHVCVW